MDAQMLSKINNNTWNAGMEHRFKHVDHGAVFIVRTDIVSPALKI